MMTADRPFSKSPQNPAVRVPMELIRAGSTVVSMFASVFNLNGRPDFVHWHFFLMSVSNLIVIVLMLILFCVAVLAPFPGAHHRQGRRS
jgi:hypothetical protein